MAPLPPSPPLTSVSLRTPLGTLLFLRPSSCKPSAIASSCSNISRACRGAAGVRCSAANKPSPSTTPGNEVSSASMAKIRSEVLSPFRSVRMFFYLAFTASAGLGALIALTQLIPAMSGRGVAGGGPTETLKGLGIDVAAASSFAFLYWRESKAKDAQVAKLTREENLSRLRVRVGAGGEGRPPVPLGELRGTARLVIVAGTGEFVTESFRRSKPFLKELMERGVLVVPFSTDGNSPDLQFDEADEEEDDGGEAGKMKRRIWQLTPVYITEWAKWLDDQKKLANVPPDSPVYLSLRLDGRVRGSGVGYPPWQAFVAQLPPVKGMWSGLLDGMDGRVL